MALNYPYTYSRMLSFVDSIVEEAPPEINVVKNILCHTISNNVVPYMKIKHQDNFSGNSIFILGRQHPGETVGSFVL